MTPASQTNQPRRTLLLTGASRGIGHATVKRFSAAGWRVITCSRHAFPENCPWEMGPEDHIQVDLADPANTQPPGGLCGAPPQTISVPTGAPNPILTAEVGGEAVTLANAGPAARSTLTSFSLHLPDASPVTPGAEIVRARLLNAQTSASCEQGPPSGSSSIASLTVAGTNVATQPVGSRIVFNPTGKNATTLYGNPIWINPLGGKIPLAIVTLNYSAYDPSTNSQRSSPLEIEFPVGGPLASQIVGRVFVSYAQSGCN